MHFLLNTLLLTLCHYRLTRLHGPASPFLLLKTWSLPLLLLQRLLDPLREQAWGLYIWQRGCDASWWVRMNHRFHWTLLSPCLPHTLWPILNTTHGGTAFPMLSSFLKGWTIKSSTLLTSCLTLLFRYMLNIFFLLFFFFFSSLSLFVMASNVGNCNRGDLLTVSRLILHTSLRPVYGSDGFARERAMPCNPNVMGYPFPPNTQAVSSFSFSPSLFAKFLYLFQSLILPSLNCSPLSKSIKN